MSATKETNPKDLVGIGKLPMHLVPAITKAYLALGHAEGMLKYGMVNWRETGVRLSVYLAALDRHMAKFNEGEWADPETGVPHLANALACLSIIVDAHHAGKLEDDRPMRNKGAIDFINGKGQEIWQGLCRQFAEAKPRHFTQKSKDAEELAKSCGATGVSAGPGVRLGPVASAHQSDFIPVMGRDGRMSF